MDISDGCGIMKQDQDGPGAPIGNDNASKGHVSEEDKKRIDDFKESLANGTANTRVKTQVQKRHRPGSSQFEKYEQIRRKSKQTPQSRLYDHISDEWLLENGRTLLGSDTMEVCKDKSIREFITFPEPIGEDFDTKTGSFKPTKRAMVKYSKNGIHFVPVMEVKKWQ